MFVKICGITHAEDAELAARLGASAVGFVFWPGSRRAISPERARKIVEVLPVGVLTVGVFVNEDPESLQRKAALAGVHMVQLHGDEDADYCARITLPVIKAVSADDQSADTIGALPAGCMVLVDAHDRERRGGTGRTANWQRARALARERRAILAGGLHAGNVADAIRAVSPWGVDVSSGVESSPGVKDAARLRAFIEAVRANEGVEP